MIALALVTLCLTSVLHCLLLLARPCGYRAEAVMATCEVLGPHSVHVLTFDEVMYHRQQATGSLSCYGVTAP